MSTHRQRVWKQARLLRLVPPDRGPGGAYFKYTGTNYWSLGQVIEQIRGRPLADVLREASSASTE